MDPTPLLAAEGGGTLPLTQMLTLPQLKARACHILLSLLAVNAAAITLLLILGHAHPQLISAGVLALSFGLRHAVDADHIAAIDNVTRRLIQDGRQPLLVGLWFSLGHSSVVGLICVATACGSAYFQEHAGFAEGVGALVSTSVSAALLLLIGAANLLSLADCCGGCGGDSGQAHPEEHALGIEAMEAGGSCGEEPQEQVQHQRGSHHTHHTGGLFARCCRGLLATIDSEWKMYLLGFMFGLGFETSSEVALLALAAMSPSQGIPPACTLVLPLLFASGMSMIDTLDGLLMSWAYGFAIKDGGAGDVASGHRLFNLYLTAASSVIAIVVGVIEVLGCVQHANEELQGPFWDVIASINDNFEYVGYGIIAFFGISTLAALAALTWAPERRRDADARAGAKAAAMAPMTAATAPYKDV